MASFIVERFINVVDYQSKDGVAFIFSFYHTYIIKEHSDGLIINDSELCGYDWTIINFVVELQE